MYSILWLIHLNSINSMSVTRIYQVQFAPCSAMNVFALQAFYPANKEASVEYGDIVAARCMFTGEGRTSNTYIGWVPSLNPMPLMLHHFIDYLYLCKPGTATLFQSWSVFLCHTLCFFTCLSGWVFKKIQGLMLIVCFCSYHEIMK